METEEREMLREGEGEVGGENVGRLESRGRGKREIRG